MKRLILTVGLPRSGKSTWAKEQGHPVVNRDSIRLAYHGKAYDQKHESMITLIENVMVKALFEAGHETVIVDATHLSQKRRDRWFDIGRPEGWAFQIQGFNAPKDVCIQRARDGGRKDLIPIIKLMAAPESK